MTTPSVRIVRLADHRGLMMIWEHAVEKDDVAHAFRDLVDCLDAAPTPMYIVVDLRADPRFPLIETFRAALNGPFRHPNLSEWLVVGANSVARSIGSTLVSVSNRDNIHWFNTLEEALDYLADR